MHIQKSERKEELTFGQCTPGDLIKWLPSGDIYIKGTNEDVTLLNRGHHIEMHHCSPDANVCRIPAFLFVCESQEQLERVKNRELEVVLREKGPMTNPKFTPGPWGINDEVSDIIWVEDNNEVETICDMYTRDRDIDGNLTVDAFPNARANAHLIAAAPEMYEMLEEVIQCAAYKLDDTLTIEIRTALAKARGEL